MKELVTPFQILLGAKSLIEKGWIQHNYAANREDRACAWWSSEARSFCAVGALNRSNQILTGDTVPQGKTYSLALHALELELPHATPSNTDGVMRGGVSLFNDTSEKRDVLALYERAIVRTKGAK